MARGKSTIRRDSVFRPSGKPMEQPPAQGKAGTPVTHQTAIWIFDEEAEWLDERCQEIRRSGWRGVTRSALIRALIRAAMARRLDLEGVAGEAELPERLNLPR